MNFCVLFKACISGPGFQSRTWPISVLSALERQQRWKWSSAAPLAGEATGVARSNGSKSEVSFHWLKVRGLVPLAAVHIGPSCRGPWCAALSAILSGRSSRTALFCPRGPTHGLEPDKISPYAAHPDTTYRVKANTQKALKRWLMGRTEKEREGERETREGGRERQKRAWWGGNLKGCVYEIKCVRGCVCTYSSGLL